CQPFLPVDQSVELRRESIETDEGFANVRGVWGGVYSDTTAGAEYPERGLSGRRAVDTPDAVGGFHGLPPGGQCCGANAAPRSCSRTLCGDSMSALQAARRVMTANEREPKWRGRILCKIFEQSWHSVTVNFPHYRFRLAWLRVLGQKRGINAAMRAPSPGLRFLLTTNTYETPITT